MYKLVLSLMVLCCLSLFMPKLVFSADLVPVSPSKAILQIKGGVLHIDDDVAVKDLDGKSICSFVLPHGAENIRLLVPGYTIVSWAKKPYYFERQSRDIAKRVKFEERLSEIETQKKILERRIELWNFKSEAFTYNDLEALAKKQAEILPEDLKKLLELDKEQKLITSRLAHLATREIEGSLITVTLDQKVNAATVNVKYSYYLSDCGWRPHYTFAIDPDKEKNEVQVRFLADVWQKSGIDWRNTEIVLVTGSSGRREPPALASWSISAREPKAKHVEEDSVVLGTDMVNETPIMYSSARRAATVGAARRPSHGVVVNDTSGVYSRWSLASRSLDEGKVEMLIKESVLQTPLTWIARPNRNAGQVFLMAKMPIPVGHVWPDGQAVYMVQGQETGQGRFTASDGEVVLYFGSDPRVVFTVYNDKNKRGETGFFGREKTWSWAWDYTIKNNHARTINIRVERPEPRAVNEDIKVILADKPKANLDNKKHILYWELTLAAGQETTIHHDLTIKAPEKMILNPIVP